MNNIAKIYIDTNVMIAIFETRGVVQSLLRNLVNLSSKDPKISVTTSLLTLSEALVRPFREKNDIMASVYNSVFKPADWVRIYDVDQPTLEIAALLRSGRPGLKLPDAIHIATALQSRCTHFMTNDMKLRDVPALTHPFHGAIDITPLSVIRPDEATLTALLQGLSR